MRFENYKEKSFFINEQLDDLQASNIEIQEQVSVELERWKNFNWDEQYINDYYYVQYDVKPFFEQVNLEAIQHREFWVELLNSFENLFMFQSFFEYDIEFKKSLLEIVPTSVKNEHKFFEKILKWCKIQNSEIIGETDWSEFIPETLIKNKVKRFLAGIEVIQDFPTINELSHYVFEDIDLFREVIYYYLESNRIHFLSRLHYLSPLVMRYETLPQEIQNIIDLEEIGKEFYNDVYNLGTDNQNTSRRQSALYIKTRAKLREYGIHYEFTDRQKEVYRNYVLYSPTTIGSYLDELLNELPDLIEPQKFKESIILRCQEGVDKDGAKLNEEELIFDKKNGKDDLPEWYTTDNIDSTIYSINRDITHYLNIIDKIDIEEKDKEHLLKILNSMKVWIKEYGLNNEFRMYHLYYYLEKKGFPQEITEEAQWELLPLRFENNQAEKKVFDEIHEYIGGTEDELKILSKYIKSNSLHTFVLPLENLMRQEIDPEVCRKMLIQSGMGTGMQAEVLREICNIVSKEFFEKLYESSVYPDKEPALANLNEINLIRIKNELVLLTNRTLFEILEKLPKDSALKKYGTNLALHPSINVTAVEDFVTYPPSFFESRTGHGEDDHRVGTMLDRLSPVSMIGVSPEDVRDGIVEGTFDRLSEFPSVEAVWSSSEKVNNFDNKSKELNRRYQQFDISTVDYIELTKEEIGDLGYSARSMYEKSWNEFRFEVFNAELRENEQTLEKMIEFTRNKGARFVDVLISKEKKLRTNELIEHYKKAQKSVNIVTERISGIESNQEKLILKKGKEWYQNELSDLYESLHKAQHKFENISSQLEQENQEIENLQEQLQNLISSEVNFGTRETVIEFWDMVTQLQAVDTLNLKDIFKRAGIKEHETDQALIGDLIESSLTNRKLFLDWTNKVSEQALDLADAHWYCAKIVEHSNELFATAGSSTGNCDAFGHGKRSHFMINPGVGQFVLYQHKNGRPKEWEESDIVAQSLITQEKDLFYDAQDREEFYKKLFGNDGRLGDYFSGDVDEYEEKAHEFMKQYLNASESLCLDSVEVKPNTQKQISKNEMFGLLQTALQKFGVDNEFYDKKVTVGTQYSYLSDADGLPKAENTGAWVTPLAYSDNDYGRKEAILLQEASENKSKVSGEEGIRPMKPHDIMAVSLVEDIAFRRSGGGQYITGYISMANEMYSSVLQSECHGHNPLSLVDMCKDENGEMVMNGYVLAYKRNEYNGEEIYITDMATTGRQPRVGTRLLMSLLNQAATDNKLSSLNIRMDCRGETSAKILAKEKSRKMIEELEFVNQKNEKIRYRVRGPDESDIKGDGLFEFVFEPYIVAQEEIDLEL